MSDCAFGGRRPRMWEGVEVRQLPYGTDVHVREGEDPHVVEALTERGATHRYTFSTAKGDRVTSVTVDGTRWTLLSEPDWDDLGITD